MRLAINEDELRCSRRESRRSISRLHICSTFGLKKFYTIIFFLGYQCPEGYRKCGDGLQCMGDWQMCNGNVWCNDGSDENPYACAGKIPKTQNSKKLQVLLN